MLLSGARSVMGSWLHTMCVKFQEKSGICSKVRKVKLKRSFRGKSGKGGAAVGEKIPS